MTNRTDILRDDASDPFAGERLKVSYFHDREKVLNLRTRGRHGTALSLPTITMMSITSISAFVTPAAPMTSVRCRNIWLKVRTLCRC